MLASNENTFGFSFSKRGYESSEVDDYIGRLRKEHTEQIAFLEERLQTVEAELAIAKGKEEAVHLTLLAATKTKDELLGAAQRQLDDATSTAREEADKILADARYEAFKTLTDINEEAEQTLTEARTQARTLVEDATSQAETTLSEARREAITIITEIKAEGERLVSERERELATMQREFDEEHGDLLRTVDTYRRIAIDLETRLTAVARGAIEQLGSVAPLITADIEGDILKLTKQGSPAVVLPSEEEAVTGREPRGSYYRRNSARLPRLGVDATNSVSEAIRALRPQPEDDGRAVQVPREDPADVAIELVGQRN